VKVVEIKMKNNIKQYNRDAIFCELKKYCHFAKEGDCIEITEWYNGEGFDAIVSSNGDKYFSLTWGQYRLLKKIIKKLNEKE